MKMHTAGLLVIKDKKLLFAFSNNKQCFYLPGGKIEPAETAQQALCREIAEEMHVQLAETDLEYYTHITAPAFGESAGVVMEQDCFLLKKEIAPRAAAEIGALRYFTLKEYALQARQAPGAVQVLRQLTAAGLIDG